MKTIANAIRLMRQFSEAEPKFGVSELARRLDLDRATVHRMLRTLCDNQLVQQEPDTKLYRLGFGLLQLSQDLLRQYGIGDIARPHLESLRDEIGETIVLKISQGGSLICIAAAEGNHPVRISFYVGEESPLHCTSAGILYLGYMSAQAQSVALDRKLKKFTPNTVTDHRKLLKIVQQARQDGVSFSDSFYLEGVSSVSVPVLAANGDLYAALTISVPNQRVAAGSLSRLVDPLKATAARIGRDVDRFGTVRGMPNPPR